MLSRLYYLCANFVSWLIFGAVGLAFNLACAVLLVFPGRRRREPAVRAAIRILFALWIWWLRKIGLILVNWRGPAVGAMPRRTVYISNHPGLLDAPFLLAHLPGAMCIFKPALLRNPFLAPAAIAAGYVAGDAGLELVRDVADKVAAGRALLLFPEGTRTEPGAVLNPLKPGFALIAQRAGVPVQILIIEASRDLLAKNRPWWSVPRYPSTVEIHLDRLIPHDPSRAIGDLTAEVEGWYLQRLSGAP
jgi:1-acyl-sn-glycerol-3-phosphate acyltransferase